MTQKQPDPSEIFQTPFTPAAPPEVQAPATEKAPRRRKTAKAKEPKEAAPKTPRRRANPVPAAVRTPGSLKLPLSVALGALSEVKPDDVPLLEKLLGILNGAGKGQRTRVLAAIGKIFG